MEVRKLQAEDIIAIKDDLIEQRDIFRDMTDESIKTLASIGLSFTCFDGEKIIACYGGIKIGNTWNAWAIYSNKASCFTRARAAVILREKLYEWKKNHPECKLVFDIPSDLPKGERYGDFLGAEFIGVKQSELFAGVENNIYEAI